MYSAERHTEMGLVKSYWHVFVNSIADVSQHELLESY